MPAVVCIVEGDGEVTALPVLLRRLRDWKTPDIYPEIRTPLRVRRDRFLNRPEEFYRFLKLAYSKCDGDGWILILLDADDDCPAELGSDILQRAQKILPDQRISVILANREYEAWYIAGSIALSGHRGFVLDAADHPVNAESIRNAKGWLSHRMGENSYREVVDQPAFSALMDLERAFDLSRSFRKLCDEWMKQMSG